MAKYKVLINGQRYKISMEDANDYMVAHESAPTEDIIDYWVDEENQQIHASIKNPSTQTLALISQNRCYLWLDRRMTRKWAKFRGMSGADGQRKSWKRGLQRTLHPYWTKSYDCHVKITMNNLNDIILPLLTGENDYPNVGFLNYIADYIQSPPRTKYYILFKPILVSVGVSFNDFPYAVNPSVRSYQTKTKVTKLIIQRE